ncbi:MAG: hypothetical protein A3G81_02735 [Betaproteobacteria bacterium RIFCSPLOWO2_12_FULL_65_14]|nr:MAG: hypothetical protein A3G81_02735 [Betaproteobacteria bacterium RIFCSPLOWO2_12_FULL_65_14]
MKLDTLAISNATGAVTGALFTLCALLLAVAPAAAYAGFSYLFHADLAGIAYAMTWGVYLGGLIAWVVAMWLVAGALAWLYNRLAIS